MVPIMTPFSRIFFLFSENISKNLFFTGRYLYHTGEAVACQGGWGIFCENADEKTTARGGGLDAMRKVR
jgi:hypothetical protein